ncbi:MAG TPA: hypothetical protein VG148_03805 [Pyrinomonadaceae bacterium]|nr:hypothetical protein [Pyrinomonadaceae bacterium]
MSKWDDFFVQKFNIAFGRGAGRGPARGDSLVGQVARTTFRLLHDNLSTPPWAREREELDAAVEGARADLLRSWNAHQESLKRTRAAAQAEADWQRVVADFRRRVADLNRRIAASNLKAPSARHRRPPVDPEKEITEVTSDR